MKKFLYSTLFVFFTCNVLSAQKLMQDKTTTDKFYTDIKISYGFPFMGDYVSTYYSLEDRERLGSSDGEYTWVIRNSTLDKNIKLSYGQGPSAQVQFGYRIIPYISVEMGLGYLYGFSNYMLTDVRRHMYIEYENYYDEFFDQFYVKKGSKSNLFSGSVSVVFSPNFKRWNPYLKVGLLVYAGTMTLSEDRGSEKSDNYYGNGKVVHSLGIIREEKYTGLSGVGFTSSLGLLCHISKLISVFAEFNVNAINCTATKSEIVRNEEYWRNDNEFGSNDKLEELKTWERYTNYANKFEWSDGDPQPSPDKPGIALKERFPFSSIGLSVGIRLRF